MLPTSRTLHRKALTAALLSVLTLPAYAGVNCQLVDASGAPLPLDSTATGDQALACGTNANASSTGSTALGSWVDVDGDGLVDANEVTWGKGVNATAVGAAAQALGANSTAIGVRALTVSDGSVAIGNQAGAVHAGSATTTTSLYTQGSPQQQTSTTIATTPSGSSVNAVAMGSGALANGSNNIALGTGSRVRAINGSVTVSQDASGVITKIETRNETPAQNSIAMGNNATVNGNGSIALGSGATVTGDKGNQTSFVSDWGGSFAQLTAVESAVNSIAIGNGATSKGNNNVVIGAGAATGGDTLYTPFSPNWLPDQNSTVIGAGAQSVRTNGTAIGYTSIAYSPYSSALGYMSYALGTGSVAVGGWLDWGQAFGSAPRGPGNISNAYGKAFATSLGTAAFGSGTYAFGNYATALGPAASTGDRDTENPGPTSVIRNYDSTDAKVVSGSFAGGFFAQAAGRSSVAVGREATAADADAIARVGRDSCKNGPKVS